MMMDYDVEFQLAADNPYDIFILRINPTKQRGSIFRYRFKFRYQCGVELGKQIRQYDPTAKIILLRLIPILSILLFFIR